MKWLVFIKLSLKWNGNYDQYFILQQHVWIQYTLSKTWKSENYKSKFSTNSEHNIAIFY